jgi:type I restriction enzyme M protein
VGALDAEGSAIDIEVPRHGDHSATMVSDIPRIPWRAVNDAAAVKNHAAFIWAVADLLRGDYKPADYGKVILPFTVLRRLDCVLEDTKPKVIERFAKLKGTIENVEPVLCAVSGEQFYNTNALDFQRLLDDPNQLTGNLRAYIAGFSSGARDVLERFDFDTQIAKLDRDNLLYLVVSKFAEIDLHPGTVSNLEMGYLYEELIRRFSELSNETAGEYFTPREVIRLMVNILFSEDADVLTKPGTVRTLYDPACGTGGMLSVAEDYLRHLNPGARLEVFGQELNDATYAICRSDMMLKGQDASHIVPGNSFSDDGHAGQKFDYCLANPPFGVDWKKVEDPIRKEHAQLGFRGRFGAGLPDIDDGALLFLQHMISKMRPVEQGGSRIAIVFNGSPLFTGAAGGRVSEIRRWIVENDWLEAVVALPDQLFYNTGISTYFWIVTNRKSDERRGKVQLVDAREMFVRRRKSLGEKRKQIDDSQIDEITRIYASLVPDERVKILPNEAFGYLRITVERPRRVRWVLDAVSLQRVQKSKTWKSYLASSGGGCPEGSRDWSERFGSLWGKTWSEARVFEDSLRASQLDLPAAVIKELTKAAMRNDPQGVLVTDRRGRPEPDAELRDTESVPLPAVPVTWEKDPSDRLEWTEYRAAIDNYMSTEVLPHVAEAWVDHTRTKIGYEIPLTRLFYKYVPPRPLADIDLEIKQLEEEIRLLLGEVTE